MRLDDLNDDFRDILVALLDEGVEFMIVGAWAVAMHKATPMIGNVTSDTLAVPMRFEHSSTATKPASTRS
jgi:hypothetical protein